MHLDNFSVICDKLKLFLDDLKVKFHFFISSNSGVCATIEQTKAIGKCH